MRNIKMLGLLAVSAMALVAFVGTSSAVAGGHFNASGALNLSETTIKNHVFTVTGEKVECAKITFTGTTTAGTSLSQTVKPKYEECKAFGFNATIHDNGCGLELKSATTTGAGATEHATARIENCPGDKTVGIQITVKVPFVAECIVDVPEQSIADAVHYSKGANNDIIVTATGRKIMTDVTKKAGLCPLEPGTHEDGTYDGESTVQGEGGTLEWTL